MRLVATRDRTVDQINHRLMYVTLREFLLKATRTRSDAPEGIGSVGCRASAVLYALLIDHHIDRRGRCRSCRWSGAVIGFRRCRIHLAAIPWLLQPDEATLRSLLASELGLGTTPLPEARRPRPRSLLTVTARIEHGALNEPGGSVGEHARDGGGAQSVAPVP